MKRCLIVCLSFCISALAAGEMIGHWRFNEAGGKEIKDCKGKFNAELAGQDEYVRRLPGRNGYAVYFGGDPAKKNVAGAALIKFPAASFTKPFTVEMWLKLDKDAPMRKFKDIIGNGTDRGPGFRITHYYNGIQVRSGDGTKPTTLMTNSATTVIPSGSWFQLAVTYDGSVGRIYINGEEKISGEINLTQAKSDWLTVGAYSRGNAYPMFGACDELKIYDYSLSGNEIIQNYLKGLF